MTGFFSGSRVSYEVDRSVGSAATMEYETVQDQRNHRDDELRLNLFMNSVTPLSVSNSNVTTV